MSVNKYNALTGELTTLASGMRCWIGTKAAYDAEKQAGTLPSNCLIAITDDSEDNNYSTDEKLTGKFWIDGKPIYRKVIDLGALPDSKEKTIAHNIDNIDTIVTLRGMCSNTSQHNFATIPRPSVLSFNHAIDIFTDMTNITVITATDYTAFNGFAIVEYTKTTD